MTAPRPEGYSTNEGFATGEGYATGDAYSASTAGSTAVGGADTGNGDPHGVADVSVGQLLGAVTEDLSTLMRQEIALAKAEMTVEAKKAGQAAGMFGGAGFAGYLAVLFVSIAAWQFLNNVLDSGVSALIVALVWAAVGAALFVVGRNKAREINPTPERTVETAKQIPDALKPANPSSHSKETR
jgi:hypothetical protein